MRIQVEVAEMAGDATSAVLFCIDESGVYCLIRGFGRRRLGVQDKVGGYHFGWVGILMSLDEQEMDNNISWRCLVMIPRTWPYAV